MYWVSILNSDTDHSSVINSDHWFAFRFPIIWRTVHVCRHRAICLTFQRYDKCSSTIFYKDVAWVRIALWSPFSQRSFSQQILTLLKGAVCEKTWIQVKSYMTWVKSLNCCMTVSLFVTWVGLHRAVLTVLTQSIIWGLYSNVNTQPHFQRSGYTWSGLSPGMNSLCRLVDIFNICHWIDDPILKIPW